MRLRLSEILREPCISAPSGQLLHHRRKQTVSHTVKSSIRSASSPQRTARYVRFLVSVAWSIRAPLVLASLTYSSGEADYG